MKPKFENPWSQVNINIKKGLFSSDLGKSPPKYIVNMIANEIIVIYI